jgi:F420-non-reducing hydrogenase iron-sulfur subunit
MSNFEPKIIGFLCNWCSYAGADKAGSAQKTYPANISLIRVMCSGRVEPEFVLESFKKGADGVLILACHPGDCHYKDGNLRALGRFEMLRMLLVQFGIEPERCIMQYISASEGDRFVQLVKDMTSTLRELGPLQISI